MCLLVMDSRSPCSQCWFKESVQTVHMGDVGAAHSGRPVTPPLHTTGGVSQRGLQGSQEEAPAACS